ncbi:unnamed protein product [Spirodela intermedia]|uniref:Uncharacterized protein n=1 Tax=Spirodela intermedia TaxID=51605 RepID=A0A7I8J8B9_SPIIN|nr:unnamed protein product [Spirodela intermedia]CAA6666427.1 unnamed protein product [Spirodela intermedia]
MSDSGVALPPYSGARYPMVPARTVVEPKSPRWASKSASRRTLLGLTSRWTTVPPHSSWR